MIVAASLVWGSIPTWALFLLGIFAAWRLSKGGAGSAVTELSKANEVLDKRMHDQGAEIRDLRVQNAELLARTDVTLAIKPAVVEIVYELSQHEGRAVERHQAQLEVLGEIARTLREGRAA